MAHCVYSLINEGLEDQGIACMVHTSYSPCGRDGQPASPIAVHIDDGPWKDGSMALWSDRTGRQRPLAIHHGSLTDDTHTLTEDCVCGPDRIAAVDPCLN